jgi:hypothetical protein
VNSLGSQLTREPTCDARRELNRLAILLTLPLAHTVLIKRNNRSSQRLERFWHKATSYRFTKSRQNGRSTWSDLRRCEDTVEGFMGNHNDPGEENRRKPYENPTVTKLRPEEAKLKLIDLASHGDEQAKEMLVMMFPEEARRLSAQEKACL